MLSRRAARSSVQASAIDSSRVAAQARFKITGMTCAGCATTIKAALERTAGVRRAEVSYERAEAVVDYDPQVTSPEKIREAINETGFTAEVERQKR